MRDRPEMRLTHKPTGITVRTTGAGPRAIHRWRRWANDLLRILLKSKLSAPEVEPIRRTYDLCPPLGIEPNIRQGDRWLVTGRDEVQKVLDGDLSRLYPPPP